MPHSGAASESKIVLPLGISKEEIGRVKSVLYPHDVMIVPGVEHRDGLELDGAEEVWALTLKSEPGRTRRGDGGKGSFEIKATISLMGPLDMVVSSLLGTNVRLFRRNCVSSWVVSLSFIVSYLIRIIVSCLSSNSLVAPTHSLVVHSTELAARTNSALVELESIVARTKALVTWCNRVRDSYTDCKPSGLLCCNTWVASTASSKTNMVCISLLMLMAWTAKLLDSSGSPGAKWSEGKNDVMCAARLPFVSLNCRKNLTTGYSSAMVTSLFLVGTD